MSAMEDKVYRVLELIADSAAVSQRDLASTTGFSLGMVNVILRRLVQTGHIKVASLNKKKFRYILTPKGLSEKAERTYSYVSRTIRTFLSYQNRLEDVVRQMSSKGQRRFAILGESEIAPLLEMAMRNVGDGIVFRRIADAAAAREGETVLDCRIKGKKDVGISILSQLLTAPAAPARPSQLVTDPRRIS